MTAVQIDVNPLYLSDIVFATADDSFEKAISSVTFTPSSKNATFQGGTPDATFTYPGPTTWTCDLEFAQDWDTANSLSLFLFNNQGETIAVTFTPKTGGASIAATLIVTPGSIGGNIGSVSTSKVSLGVQGKPTITPAA